MMKFPALSKSQTGFSLIELMIVVAIIAIMGTLAYPAYEKQVQKGNRTQARVAIMEVLAEQERYFTRYNTFKAFSEGDADSGFKAWSGDGGKAKASHHLKAEPCDNNIKACVKVTAVPKKKDTVEIWMQSSGQKGCTPSTEVCWQ